ncbi:MAG TPA: MBL fold metallo-hydrolase [Syntrophomonadaceae bacterium]|nr:MBL fold metallo-hydrolase [Syntrophomonadaceae bacterium]HPR92677.1 MBL fold metallo-hydrolase [Syntrophomonadaceae bacterium]
MEMKWYGTAAISLTTADETIIFDPFLSFNDAEKHISLQEIANIEHIFITHGHFDHTMHIPELLEASLARVYCHETVAAVLQKKGVAAKRIVCIKPGDVINLDNFEIKVLRGEHISFDWRLIMKTIFCRRVLKWLKNTGKIINGFIKYPKGQVLIYHIKAEGQQILHMGSMGMCFDEDYPSDIEILTLPFQGRSDIDDFAMHFIRRINPKAVFLHHFDDSFPPISNEIDITGFLHRIVHLFPNVKVIKPDHLKKHSIA